MNNESVKFDEVFDKDLLAKVYSNFDSYMEANDFTKSLIDEMFIGVSANQHLNYMKIMGNLGFTKEDIDNAPQFILWNCIGHHLVDLSLNSPEKITLNHKISLISYDTFHELHGDSDYPHETVEDQIKEFKKILVGEEGIQFVATSYKLILPDYIENYNEHKGVN